jgi:hypothetical protein
MEHTREAITTNVAARGCWHVAPRDDGRVARRLYRQPVVDGVSPLGAGAWREECLPVLAARAVLTGLQHARGKGVEREWGPMGPDILRDGRKPLGDLERLHAWPAWRVRDAASMPVGGFQAPPGRPGVGQRGAAQRPGLRTAGPLGPAARANHRVTRDWRALAAWFKGARRALSKAGRCRAQGPGRGDGPALETTAPSAGGGPVPRPRPLTEMPGPGRAMAVTVSGWQVLVWRDAATKRPRAVTVVPRQAHDGRCLRALGPPARAHLEGSARRSTGVVARGWRAGTEVGGLDQHGSTGVVPAPEALAVSADARALAAASDGLPVGRRAHPGRPGQGREAWRARLETAGGGRARLTPDDPSGTRAHGRPPHRRACPPTPIQAVGVRPWPGRADGPGGRPVCLTHAAVPPPVQPLAADEDRRLLAHGGSQARPQPWRRRPPPQKTARAVRVHVGCTRLRFARATASRRRCAAVERGTAPVSWQRGRRQLRPQNREQRIVFAQGDDGIWHGAESSMWLGAKLTDVPPGIGTRQEVLARSELISHG